MKAVCRLFFFFLLVFLLQIKPLLVRAENIENTTEISLAAVLGKINSIKNKANIDEALRLRILNAYYVAEDNLEELTLLEQQIQVAQKQLETLPTTIKQLGKQFEKAETQLINQKREKLSLYPNDELKQRLIIEKSKLNELKSSINLLEIQITEQLNLPQRIREQVVEIKQVQAKTLQEQAVLAKLVENKQEFDAHQMQLDSLARKLNATLTKLELENIIYPLKVQAQKLELQLKNVKSKQLNRLIEDIDELLFERKQEEIERAQVLLKQAQKEGVTKHKAIQLATAENIKYNQLLQKFNKKLELYINQKSKIEKQHKQLEIDFQSAEQKINLAGLSPALGNLLREQRRNLPLQKAYEPKFDKIQKEIALTNLELFHLAEVQKSLKDMDRALILRMRNSLSENPSEKEKLKIRTELRPLLNNQLDLVFRLSSVYSGYSRILADVDFALQQLVNLGEEYRLYLDQRLLWVPSAPVVNKQFALETFNTILWFFQPKQWWQFVIDIYSSVQNSLIVAPLGLILISCLLWFRRKIKINLKELLNNSSSPYADRFNYTFYGIVYIFLLVLPMPITVAWFGWLLRLNEQASEFSDLFANGLLTAALPLLIIQFFYRLLKPRGIVQSLFDWQDDNVILIHRQLKWLRFIVTPALFLMGMFVDDGNIEHSYSLGRMAHISLMLVLAYFLHRLAHPVSGIAKDFYLDNASSWACRLRYVWYAILVLIPLVIIGFAIVGYYQSALELQHKMVILLRLVFFSVLFHEIVMRWMVLANRKLVLQNIRQKRQQHELTVATEERGPMSTAILEEEELLDISKINEQSKKLLMALILVILFVGSWLTLQDILPVFSVFDEIVLWQHLTMIDGQESLQPITVINIFVCLLYLILMWVFINNFPGLIDLLFAGRYSMAAGSRYALLQLTRYAVVLITLIAIANELGGSWSQVQWLVAAVSVGLGFGLQEIFANMVSGVILLFERPIRVGDTVTVGDVTGTVCKIQMRATTITDWNQKELVVPNKTLITDKLINWSLSDTMSRIVIQVGISYDADEEKVRRLLNQVIEEIPLVLKTPEPTIYFIGFGESSLDFSIRVFVNDLRDRLPVTDELHSRIRRAFKENNIEIPFPQRDLHMR